MIKSFVLIFVNFILFNLGTITTPIGRRLLEKQSSTYLSNNSLKIILRNNPGITLTHKTKKRIKSRFPIKNYFIQNQTTVDTKRELQHSANSIAKTTILPILKTSNLGLVNPYTVSKATLEQFGAKGDGITDDTEAITKALNSTFQVIYARKTMAYYKISNMIVVNKISEKKLVATGAILLNSDLTKATFLFQDSKNIEIQGGDFGYVDMPIINGGNSQHVFQFEKCQNVLVNKIHIKNSPEMGIAITNSNHVTIQNSLIEHTFRDGTYAHYSANVKYIHNTYNNIKDDAMSFHDYGLPSQKKQLIKFGYKQATNLIAKNNTVKNAYQGFGSIGAKGVQVINNRFLNTVLSGIAIFNSKELYPTGTALVNNAHVLNNTINNACSSVTINNKLYNNNGQASTGRAAIFIGSLGVNNQINMGETKLLKNVTIKGNKVQNSGAHGFLGGYIDQLVFTDNMFYDCSGAIPSQSLSGDVIEIGNVTNFLGNNNTIVDTRPKALHSHGYALNNVTGKMGNWHVKGVAIGEKSLIATTALRHFDKPKQTKTNSAKK